MSGKSKKRVADGSPFTRPTVGAGTAIPSAFLTGEVLTLPSGGRSAAMDEQIATDLTDVEEHAVKEITIASGVAVLDGPSGAQLDGRESIAGSEEDENEEEEEEEDDEASDLPLFAEVAAKRAKETEPTPAAQVTQLRTGARFGSKSDDDDDEDYATADEEDESYHPEEDAADEAEEDEDEDETEEDEDIDRSKDTAIRLSRADIADAVRELKPHPKYQTDAPLSVKERLMAKIKAERAHAAAEAATKSETKAPPETKPKSARIVKFDSHDDEGEGEDEGVPVNTVVRSKAEAKIAEAKAKAAQVKAKAVIPTVIKDMAPTRKAEPVPTRKAEPASALATAKAKAKAKAKATATVEREDDADSLIAAVPLALRGAREPLRAPLHAPARAPLHSSGSKKAAASAAGFADADELAELRAQVAAAQAHAREMAAKREAAATRAAEAAKPARSAAYLAEVAALKRQLEAFKAHAEADAAEAYETDLSLAMHDATDELAEEEARLTPAARRAKEREAAHIKALAAAARADREGRRARTAHEAADIKVEVARMEKERSIDMEAAIRAVLEYEAKKEAEEAAAKATAAASKSTGKGKGDKVRAGAAPAARLDEETNAEDDALLAKFLEEHGGPVELEDHSKYVRWMNVKLKDDSKTVNRDLEELERTRPDIIRRAKAEYQRIFEEEELARTKLKSKAMVRIDPKTLKERDDARDKMRELTLSKLAAARSAHADEMEREKKETRNAALKTEFTTWHLKDALTRMWVATTGADATEMPRSFLRANAAAAQELCKREAGASTTMARLWERFSRDQAAAAAAAQEAAAAERDTDATNDVREVRDALHAHREGPPRSFSGATSGAHMAALSHKLMRHEGPPRNACDE